MGLLSSVYSNVWGCGYGSTKASQVKTMTPLKQIIEDFKKEIFPKEKGEVDDSRISSDQMKELVLALNFGQEKIRK